MQIILKSLLHCKNIRSSGIYIFRCKFATKIMADKKTCELLECTKSFVPLMKSQMHKGQCGRISVIGGCSEYTGAPYFAAISALKTGADLAHVFCMQDAAPVIKSYSPELIVHPILDTKNSVIKIDEWMERMHCLVIGPGLGRDPSTQQSFRGILDNAKKRDLPVILDADSVYFITQDPDVIKGYPKATITPNRIEFMRLYEKLFGEKCEHDRITSTKELALKLNGVTIVSKGESDVISNGKSTITCSTPGSVRRCGGQGDLLSGAMGTFTFWAYQNFKAGQCHELLQELGPNICAAFSACYLTRQCNNMAFCKYKRSTTTSDMIGCIGEVFDNNFENSLE